MMTNLANELAASLQKDERLWAGEKLLKNQVTELALKLDPALLRLLLSHDRLKSHFFVDIDGILVFDRDKFVRFINNKAFLPDSYTSFKNKIGLATPDGRYLSQNRDVVLVWPYKDCVLEGGQTKEEQKRDEIFWNEILAPDDINRLLAPKALTNWRRYDAGGGHDVTGIQESDNLIIKGNNLLALASLKKRFAGKVKLIYIDPPYNTGNDSFGYNDRFNHSTWLTFMKNRLELARTLLRKDGSIWINIDDDEAHYLKVLCDDVFGKENFIGNVIWQHSIQGKGYGGKFSLHHNYILVYSNSISFTLGLLERTEEHNKNYSNSDNDPKGPWRTGDIRNALYRPNLIYDVNTPSGKIIKPPPKGWRFSKETMEEKIKSGQIIFSDDETRLIYKIYLKDQEGRVPETIWFGKDVGTTREANRELKLLFGEKLFNTPKPEGLIQRILHIASNSDDIVLDFFSGSGTTAAVAHKMGRQYIAVEQMDYVETITIERLKKVIGRNVKPKDELIEKLVYDQGGVSKSVGWQGGGSFVYCELMQWDERFIKQIRSADGKDTLQAIWQEMRERADLSYRLDLKQFDENAAAFADLSLDDQRRFLLESLDKNQLYVNLSEIDDATYAVSDEDKQLNRQFYGE